MERLVLLHQPAETCIPTLSQLGVEITGGRRLSSGPSRQGEPDGALEPGRLGDHLLKIAVLGLVEPNVVVTDQEDGPVEWEAGVDPVGDGLGSQG